MTQDNGVTVSVRLPRAVVDCIAEKIERGEYLNPSDCIRQVVVRGLKNESA